MEHSSAASSIETARLLDALCALLRDPDCERRSCLTQEAAEDQAARFRIWGGNLGAFQRLPATSSLDHRLRESPKIATQINRSLQDICEAVTSVIAISSGERPNRQYDEDDDSSSDEELQKSWAESDTANLETPKSTELSETKELFGGIKDTIASLFRLAMIIRRSSPRDRFAKALDGSNPFDERYDVAHVRDKFPKLEVTRKQWLCKRLGRAITQRRQFLRYAREHRVKLDKGAARHQEELGTGAARKFLEPSFHVVQKSQAGRTDTTKPLSTLAPTAASTILLQDLPVEFDFTDVQSQTSFAVSLGDEEDADRIKLPSLSEVSKGAASFECPLCWTIQSFRKESAWRKHIYSDLRPYVCTFGNCDLRLFSDRRDWFEHELQHHRTRWVCQFCHQDGFKTGESFREHLLCKHIQGATDAQLDALSETSASPVTSIPASECPFCDDWASSLLDKNPDLPGDVIVVTLSQFRHHVGLHLQNLALFAIPRGCLDNGDADASSTASVQAAVLGSLNSSKKSGTSSRSLSSEGVGHEMQEDRNVDIEACARHIESQVITGTSIDIIAALTNILPVLTSPELERLEDHIFIPKVICTTSASLRRIIEATCHGKYQGEASWIRLWPSIPWDSQLWWSIIAFILIGRRGSAYRMINKALIKYGLSISAIVENAFSGTPFSEWVFSSLKLLAVNEGKCGVSPIENFHEHTQTEVFHEWITSTNKTDEKRTELLAWCMGEGGPLLRRLNVLYRARYPTSSLISSLLDFFSGERTDSDQLERRLLRNLVSEVVNPKRRDTNLLREVLAMALSSSLKSTEQESEELLTFHISRLHWIPPERLTMETGYEVILDESFEQELTELYDFDFTSYFLALIRCKFDVSLLDLLPQNDSRIGDRIRNEICGIPGVISCLDLGLWRPNEAVLEARPVFQFDPEILIHDPARFDLVKNEVIPRILQESGISQIPEESSALVEPSGPVTHWATRILEGPHTSTTFQALPQPIACYGRDEPQLLQMLREDDFEKVLEMQPGASNKIVVSLYWRDNDNRARIMLLNLESDSIRSLQLLRKNRKTTELFLWANLQFHVYEEMVLFYNTAVAMRSHDETRTNPELYSDFSAGEKLEFSGEIQDGRYLHVFRVYQDDDTGCVRFEITPRRGPRKHVTIWTAFVTEHIGQHRWMSFVVGTNTVQFSELHPHVFCDGYTVPKGPSGRYELKFTDSFDLRELEQVLNSLAKTVTIPQELPQPIGLGHIYSSVHVLVIKWADSMGPLELQKDVECLTSVFRNVLGYDVTECILTGSDSDSFLSAITATSSIKSKDSPETLFILCYAGLADLDETDGTLCFTPYDTHSLQNRFSWKHIADVFLANEMQGDVLQILDCHFINGVEPLSSPFIELLSVSDEAESERVVETLLRMDDAGQVPTDLKSLTQYLADHLERVFLRFPKVSHSTTDILGHINSNLSSQPSTLHCRIQARRNINLGILKSR